MSYGDYQDIVNYLTTGTAVYAYTAEEMGKAMDDLLNEVEISKSNVHKLRNQLIKVEIGI